MHRNEPYGTACLLFLFSFLFFHVFRIPVPLNVDTYLYARAIETFEGPVVHLGYYLIGALCHSLLETIGITPLQTLGYISQFSGGISVAGIYVFIFLLTENRLHSLLSAIVLMFSGAFWLFSIHGEVYVPQLAFVLLALICLLKMRPLLSSLSILVAVSITPTSLLAMVPLCYIMVMKRFDKRQLIYFSAPILLAFAIVMVWVGPKVIETFAKAIYSPKIFFDEFSYAGMLIKVVYDLAKSYGRSFNLISFFAIFGFLALYGRDRKLWGLMLAFLLPFLAYFFNLGLFSPDHLIITLIAVSFLGSYGILRLLDVVSARVTTRVVLIPLLLLIFLWISFELSISRQKIYATELDRVIHSLSEKSQDVGVIIADYNFGVSFWSLTREEESNDLFEGRPNGFLHKSLSSYTAAIERLKRQFWISFACIPGFASRPEFSSLLAGRPIYLVERIDWPIGSAQVFKDWLIDLGVENQEKATARLEKIREYLSYKLGTEIAIEKIIDSPLHPVYVMQPVRKSAE